MTLDLYRVGTPSIGETWLDRFTRGRGSGGLGTGVYAFRDRHAAEENIENSHDGGTLHVLHNALDRPIQPSTLDATRAINKLSRLLTWVHHEVQSGHADYDDLLSRPGEVRVSTGAGFGSDPGVGQGTLLHSVAFDILLGTTELREEYSFDEERFVTDALEATREASRACSGRRGPPCVQPINHLLWPQFDGVAPYDSAGGNAGKHGCVVFKQKVDACVGHKTESFEEIPAARLNACFKQDDT